ncbi:hypothetical protein O0L34_g19354 [Tuta absoluta]|nr:hypothetical protein O0L34_g19354 [Tuta absoluta]
MVFPRAKFQPFMTKGAPTGTLGLASPSGWMNADLFVEVMKHFIKMTSSSPTNPSLLIMDYHESHLSIDALNLAKAAGVTILTLHPHTTAKMQPLDVGLNGPFKTYYNFAVDSWLLRHPGQRFTIYQVAECVGSAYLKSMTPSNIVNAFKKCGIFPYDDEVFTDIDFLPSSVTDKPQLQAENENSNAIQTDDESDQENVVDSISNLDNILPRKGQSPELLQIMTYKLVIDPINAVISKARELNQKKATIIILIEPTIVDAIPTFSKNSVAVTVESAVPEVVNQVSTPSKSRDAVTVKAAIPTIMDAASAFSKSRDVITVKAAVPEIVDVISSSPKNRVPVTVKAAVSRSMDAIPSTSKSSDAVGFISPKVFRPEIKAGPRKENQKARKRGKSMIATDTPEKDAIMAKKKKTTKPKTKKFVKQVKKDLFKKGKATKKKPIVSPETSDDDHDSFKCSGSSSGGECFASESEVEDVVLTENFRPLSREPQLNDYVLVLFRTKNNVVYYVARILDIVDDDDDDCDFFVSYLKLKSKIQQKFAEPLEPDTAGVKRQDIKYILPIPKTEGTSRRKSTFKFNVDMSLLNLRY